MVRELLDYGGLEHPKHALTKVNSSKEFRFRTPLMAAASTKDYGIFRAILVAFTTIATLEKVRWYSAVALSGSFCRWR